MIRITRSIVIDEGELRFEFVRASGPGGQNVNRVATAVKLRFDAARSPSIPADVRDRLARIAGRRMTAEGVLIIDARRFRTQERNRRDALDRLTELLRRAAVRPKNRRPTQPTVSARLRRLEAKRLRGEIKRRRGPVGNSDS